MDEGRFLVQICRNGTIVYKTRTNQSKALTRTANPDRNTQREQSCQNQQCLSKCQQTDIN